MGKYVNKYIFVLKINNCTKMKQFETILFALIVSRNQIGNLKAIVDSPKRELKRSTCEKTYQLVKSSSINRHFSNIIFK